MPAHLPTGIECEISARVTKLTPGHMAHLRNLTWKPATDGQTMPPVPLPESAIARRDGLTGEAGTRPLDGMDAGTMMRLGVKIEFEWATGAAKDVRLLSVAGG